ncbi:MAG: ribonuclease III [Firmicutes bacterium]|nr:ribonuclease III [Bacillota bacterium]
MEEILGYKFNNPQLLTEALTHSSYGTTDEEGVRIDNEKLEFIGDAFLDAIVGVEIYNAMPAEAKEGDLTKMRAQVVCERSLAQVGKELDIGSHLYMGIGEEKTGGREKESLIADAVEALIGAIYMDGGYAAAADFVKDKFKSLISASLQGKLVQDYKTEIQEQVQKAGKSIKYIVDRTEGPDHDKVFYIRLEIDGEPVSYGVGKSKKEAQQMAAHKLIEKGIENVL